ncbi:MAG TPA: M14 metallopeptidase family protein [Pyrinomonadaceae bacterium]|nr:M14 metallopeptidase family protein [Pyrinomonadaceae bacterium]
MHSRARAVALFITLLLSSSSPAAPVVAPAPEEVLGFRPGDDRRLASWASVVEYFKRLDAASDRVRFEELGKSTMDAPFVMATISAPENLRRLAEFKDIQRRLADPRTLGRDADRKARRLVARGKTIVLITCGIHSTEVGSYLSSMLIAHRLASSDEPEVLDILRETIVLLVPSLNPDGVDIVKDWYDKTLGTPYEGTEPPALYHKYTGHDNNRDWYAFTQRETRLAVEKIHQVWHPQIVHDIHQMGREGARLFLPPYVEPVEPNVPKQIVEGYTELGGAMAAEMRGRGFKGVVTDAIFDAWTPARAYSHYHGGVRILSETASAKLATPVSVRFDDLRPGRGYDPRKVSANFPDLWPGGEWRLRDVTNYMTTAAFALMKHAAQNRERWLTRFYEIGKEAVRPRRKGELFAFLLPPIKEGGECDDPLTYIFWRGGVEWEVTRRFTRDGVTYPEGTRVVRMDQPYGAFAKALLEAQKYPDLRDKDGRPVAPYDVTAHTLPLLMNVEARAVNAPFKYPRLRSSGGSACGKAGCKILPRAAVYKSHVPSMDAGWTQWVFEQKDWIVPVVTDERIRSGDLFAVGKDFTLRKYKTIVIPDQNPAAILNGHKPGTMPEEYTGGLGAQGVKNLREFVEAGGTLVFLNRASRFAVEQFDLPVRDVTANLKRTEFYAPGSILRVLLDTSHPVARGMPEASIAWAEDSPAFEIKSDPAAAARVRVIARYPQDSDPLLSGWLLGGDRLKGKAALVEVRLGKGRIYLFGFRPQYRGQSLATYPLFLNAVGQRAGD